MHISFALWNFYATVGEDIPLWGKRLTEFSLYQGTMVSKYHPGFMTAIDAVMQFSHDPGGTSDGSELSECLARNFGISSVVVDIACSSYRSGQWFGDVHRDL